MNVSQWMDTLNAELEKYRSTVVSPWTWHQVLSASLEDRAALVDLHWAGVGHEFDQYEFWRQNDDGTWFKQHAEETSINNLLAEEPDDPSHAVRRVCANPDLMTPYRCVVIDPGQEPRVARVSSRFDSMNATIGGLFYKCIELEDVLGDTISGYNRGPELDRNAQPNIYRPPDMFPTGKPFTIYGPVVLMRFEKTGAIGYVADMTDDQIAWIIRWFSLSSPLRTKEQLSPIFIRKTEDELRREHEQTLRRLSSLIVTQELPDDIPF